MWRDDSLFTVLGFVGFGVFVGAITVVDGWSQWCYGLLAVCLIAWATVGVLTRVVADEFEEDIEDEL